MPLMHCTTTYNNITSTTHLQADRTISPHRIDQSQVHALVQAFCYSQIEPGRQWLRGMYKSNARSTTSPLPGKHYC